jgi:alpha-glucosidase
MLFLLQDLAVQFMVACCVYTSTATAESKSSCAGYAVHNVRKNAFQLEADLELIGEGCGIYGPDVPRLALSVTYETGK